MFINKITLRRVNPHARYIDQDGTQHNKMPADLYEEIADPVRESDETHYVQEIDEYPYIINTPKPPEQLDAQHNAKVKAQITAMEVSSARAVREAALGSPSFLIAIEAKIQELRATLKPEPPKP